MEWRTEVRAGDPKVVGELVTATRFFSAEERDVAVELVDEALARGAASGYHFVLVDDSAGGISAYTCYGPIPATESSFDLYWIAVHPSAQRSGLGRKLLLETERRAGSMGARQMFVDTAGRDQYAPTRAFYERMGYRKAATLEDFYAPGDAKVDALQGLLDRHGVAVSGLGYYPNPLAPDPGR